MEVDLGVGSSCLISVRMESDQYQFLILFLKYFCPFFFFLERDIKGKQKYLFTLILMKVGYRRLTELTSGG